MSEKSRIRSCCSEVSDNLNLFSTDFREYGPCLSRSQLNSELLKSGLRFFFLTDSETFHLKMVSAGLRIAPSGSDVNLCACDKSSVSYVLQVLERSSCQIHEGVKIVKC